MKHFKKFVLICILAIISLIVIYPVCYAIYHRNASIRNVLWVEYEVKAGDSLWSIAVDNCSTILTLDDWVYRIRQKNSIDNPGALQVGSLIQIPISGR